ncbi:hypothetical protein DNU06_17060 [Putridiphycobacter roseus]|uniref:YqgE/AlgH family protein n=1 Tax=Putridiphycobacter roseus TaxID=2219161 RepID=A0A2W1MYK3_9FLAO|nr:YqgE/AlgH family protein [Putridiphycobacter roseus]PZE15631.1 hypothetical protein DNU06_17060 [Putridiphycobacter roseus]
MGIFDIFKKQKKVRNDSNAISKTKPEQKNDSKDEGIYELAYASTKYNELKKNYKSYKKELLDFGFDDSKFIHNTIGLILRYYYATEKVDALNLYAELKKDFPENEDIIWLFLEVICLVNIDNDLEFVKKYVNGKKQHQYDQHYQIEYQKGLELKRLNYFKEAIEIWSSLNEIEEFSWNYYQIGILQNLMNNKNCLKNIRKAIEMDGEIKEDAKTYPELDNLRTNQEFLDLIDFDQKPEKSIQLKNSKVKVGDYIIAIPNFPSPIFEKAVILVTRIENGAIQGVFTNKLQNKKLGDLSKEFIGSNSQVYSGGPVGENSLLYLHTLESTPNSNEILPGVYFMGDISNYIEKLKSNDISDKQIRFFNGYVSWGESQFEEEFKEGVWLISSAIHSEIMTSENTPIWEELVERIKNKKQ